MTVKELIQHLRYFDEDHVALIEVDGVEKTIEDVEFKGGNCVLIGEEE